MSKVVCNKPYSYYMKKNHEDYLNDPTLNLVLNEKFKILSSVKLTINYEIPKLVKFQLNYLNKIIETIKNKYGFI